MQLHPGQGQPRDPMCSVLTALPCTPSLPARLAQGSHPPGVAPAANTLWHLPRAPAVQQPYFFLNGFANYPAFLCCLPSEHAAGTGPRPGSSSQRESPQHACSLPGWEASSTASPRTLLAAAAAVSPCR